MSRILKEEEDRKLALSAERHEDAWAYAINAKKICRSLSKVGLSPIFQQGLVSTSVGSCTAVCCLQLQNSLTAEEMQGHESLTEEFLVLQVDFGAAAGRLVLFALPGFSDHFLTEYQAALDNAMTGRRQKINHSTGR